MKTEKSQTPPEFHPYVIGQIHPNYKLLSHSGLNTLSSCERKFQLDKLLNASEESTTDTIFGHAVGIGVQELLVTGSINKAYMASFLSWEGSIGDKDEKAVSDYKLFWHCLAAIDAFQSPINTVFATMEIATLNGRPATELGFIIDCGGGFYYRGFIDAVLIDRNKKEIVVVECKTTKTSKVHEATFKNSPQALGYSLIIDMIVSALGTEYSSSYRVYYPIYKTKVFEWEVLDFIKTHTQRAIWIKNILIDKNHIIEYSEGDHFPMRGHSCYNFFRVCQHFEICAMKTSNIARNPRLKTEDPGKYDYHFDLADIISNQLEKYGEL